jgi:hypothetical protein
MKDRPADACDIEDRPSKGEASAPAGAIQQPEELCDFNRSMQCGRGWSVVHDPLFLPLYSRSRLNNHAAAPTATGRLTKVPAKGNTTKHRSRLITAKSLAPPASSLTPAALPTM